MTLRHSLILLAFLCVVPLVVQAASPEQTARSITIYRDTYGVPHVYGPTDACCAFGYMYAQAEDNFWQIEDSYIRSLGRASEVYGTKTLEDDELVRALEIPRLAQAEYGRLPDRTKARLQAGAEGINYFLQTHPEAKPRLLTHFEPWYGLAFNRYALYFQFIYRRSGLRTEEIKTVTEPQTAKADAAHATPRDLASESAGEYKTAAETQDPNMWASTPANSATGHPIPFI